MAISQGRTATFQQCTNKSTTPSHFRAFARYAFLISSGPDAREMPRIASHIRYRRKTMPSSAKFCQVLPSSAKQHRHLFVTLKAQGEIRRWATCSRQKHYDHHGIVCSSGNQECDHLILMQDSTGAFELTANRMCVVCCAWCYFSLGDTSTARVLLNSRILLLLAHQFSSFLSSVWAKASMKQRWTQQTDAEICWAETWHGWDHFKTTQVQLLSHFGAGARSFAPKSLLTAPAKLAARLHLRQRDFRGYGIYIKSHVHWHQHSW